MIGTEPLTTTSKTLIGAINEIKTPNPLISKGSTFYGCEDYRQTITINPPIELSNLSILEKMLQCATFAKVEGRGFATVEGGDCTSVTTLGDAFLECYSKVLDFA